MRVCPATIRSYCFLHSLRSFAKTNLVKKRPKKSSNYAHGVGNYAPGILSPPVGFQSFRSFVKIKGALESPRGKTVH